MAETGDVGAESKKMMHPFFSTLATSSAKEQLLHAVQPVTPDPSCSPASDKAFENPYVPAAADADESVPGQGPRKRRKTETSAAPQQQPKKRGRPPKVRVSAGSDIAHHFVQVDVGVPVNVEAGGSHKAADATTEAPTADNEPTMHLDHLPQPSLSTDMTGTEKAQTESPDEKPKKLLIFNPKTGTIGPPPKPKAEIASLGDDKQAKLAATKSKRGKKATSLVVCIAYGEDKDEPTRTRIGETIEGIYSGVRYVSPRATVSSAAQPKAATKATKQKAVPSSGPQTPKKSTSKTTHPFFSSKPKSGTVAAEAKDKSKPAPKKQSIFTSTPCSPKHVRQPPAKFNVPQFGMKSGGSKFPGAQHPAWPWRGMVHIHGDERDADPAEGSLSSLVSLNHRKAKGRVIELPEDESVISRAMAHLELDRQSQELKDLDTEEFLPPPPSLRVPERHFESGKKLQERITPELRTLTTAGRIKGHPAIINAYNSLVTSLSAFDRSTCETISWAQKYAPTSADQVLQDGREAEMLRDWLQTLKIRSVDTGASASTPAKPKSGPVAKKKKRRKLDDFVVPSDEELDAFDNISEDEADWAPSGTHGIKRNTVVRSGALKNGRLTNAVLLSGPHGCGKTATVYAIAKELDFEVFEISPGARRNGKDILEKIGDMTRNHLVQHKQETVPKPDETIDEDEVAQEIKSGKQGVMMAFFKPKRDAKPPAPKKSALEPMKPATDKPTKTLNNNSQKQSLILLEEVDILYEEDKQFWATVIGLMTQSKRPFIMTCNDETLVPIHNLNLHGIFRFTPAPRDQAVDLMLLVAANEGHALQRNAVEALYDSRNHDLRACLGELNYWCQIGVGDPKGGFSWFCRKWPKGADLDEHGDKLRVVSAGTYHTGMGWFGRDALTSPSIYRTVDEEATKQCWEGWSLDIGDNNLSPPSDEATMIPDLAPADRLAILDEADSFYESLSAADIVSYGSFSTPNQVALDCTLPEMPSKARDDFIIGLQPLDAPSLHRYSSNAFELATSIRSLARGQVTKTELADVTDSCSLDEPRATQKVQDDFGSTHPSTPAIIRYDYSMAFDPIAASEKALISASGYLDPSVFDRTMKMITLDVAPYVRSIVAYDQRLQAERLQRSNLLSEGGKPRKRVRTTRSAYSALEGGSRSSVRREKYFSANINPHLVMRTGGNGWEALVLGDHTTEAEHAGPTPQDSSDDMEFSME